MKWLVSFALILFLIGFVSAGSVSYNIVGDRVLVEINSENLDNINYQIPFDAEALEESATSIKYITESMIEKSSKGYFFIHRIESSESLSVDLVLPESAVLFEEGVVLPSGYSTTSNGRNIILHWDNYDDEQIVVYYTFVKDSDFIFYFLIAFLILIMVVINYKDKVLSKFNKISESEKKKLLKNLYEDEKKIINFLFEQKDYECWTKALVKGVGISKVKLSRKLRSLEQKGLIKKVPYGNENRIRLIKNSN